MVVVEIETGFVGGQHTVETELTLEEFGRLTQEEKNEILEECVWEKIEATFKDEDTDDYLS